MTVNVSLEPWLVHQKVYTGLLSQNFPNEKPTINTKVQVVIFKKKK